MKERITQIAKGIVSYDAARFRIYPEQLTGELTEHQSVRREVEIRTCNGKPVKGVACSDCPHVRIKGGSFKGYVNRMTVEIDAVGLSAGEMLTGELVLSTDGGEYLIPYAYQVCGEKNETEEPPVWDSEDDAGAHEETVVDGLPSQEHENTLKESDRKTAELIKGLLFCLTEAYSKEAMEELELALMIWQEEAEPFLTAEQNRLLQVFVMYHTGCKEEGANLYGQIKDQIYAERENTPWAYLLGLYLEDRLLPEENRGQQVYQMQQYQESHGDGLSLLFLSEMDLNRFFHPRTVAEELCTAYEKGWHSPFLLWRLFQVLEEVPEIMDLQSRPMVQAFCFGVRYGMRPAHMLPEILKLLEQGMEPVCAQVLPRGLLRLQQKAGYEGADLLDITVQMLLRLQCTGERYFSLYHQAACANMHSEELFAYYLNSAPKDCRKAIARPVVLYYTYGDSLSEPLRELLYTNVQIFYSDEERIYTGYRSRIERFMMEHLLQRQINENLLFLYTTLLHPDMLDERAAAALTDILSLEHISAKHSGGATAVVRYPMLEQEWTYPLTEGEGDVSVWSPDAEMICLDEAGGLLSGTEKKVLSDAGGNSLSENVLPENGEEAYSSEPIKRTLWMENHSMENRCRQLYPSHIRFQLADLKALLENGADTREELDRMIGLANELSVSWETACRIVSIVIGYCNAHPEDTAYDGVLVGASWEALEKEEQRQVFDLLLCRGYIKEAESRIRSYGWKALPDESLAAFLKLRKETSGKTDDWQTAMCYELYIRGCRESWLLDTLCLHYNNSQEKMLALLQGCLLAGCESGESENQQTACHAEKLGERLLAQSLFTGKWEKLPEIMSCYIDAGGQDALLMSSYLVIRCQTYYMTGLADAVLQDWFSYASAQEPFQGKVPEICCMALLKWYGEKEQLNTQEQQLCVLLLEGLLQRNRCYSFFHKYADLTDIPSALEGKTILEYHGAENRQVMLVYQRDKLETAEKVILLKEQYPGVYCAAVSLFAGEELRYRLLEDGEYQAVCFTPEEPFAGKNERYVSLNQAISAYKNGDWQKVQDAVRTREIDRCMLDQLFPLNCIS